MSRRVLRTVLATLLVLVIISAFIIVWPERARLDETAALEAARQYDARILRDTWGVPHIFGVTDADAAYGLAYAHAEDDFLTIQQTLVAARGHLAIVYGMDAAANDYMVHLLRIWDVVEEQYEADLSPGMRAVLEAYAAGLNHYAVLHQDEVISPGLFPVSGKDIVAGSVHKSPLFFGLDDTLTELFSEERESAVSPQPSAFAWPAQSVTPAHAWVDTRFGSNAFSVSPERSIDGSTFLAVNSHQPWQGPVAWYEAHVHSEEGWDMTGGLFPGSPVIIHGHNRHLGWAFTVNRPDLVDVYVLEMNPDQPNQYRFDGQWLDLEIRQAPITVKLFGRLRVTVNREVLWSVYGPVVRQDHGVYALRYAGAGRINLWQQLYDMNKATTFAEWREAAAQRGLASFNVGYADADGNIMYLYNALAPVRAEGYDWSLYLPGDTSATLWTEYLPFDQLPQVVNPPSGFVQNANSTPYQATMGPGNPDPGSYSPSLGFETHMTNRSWRALELLGEDEAISFDEFIAYKYDMAYSSQSGMAKYLTMLLAAPQPADPELQAALELLRSWDLQADPDDRATALATLMVMFLAEANPEVNTGGLTGVDVPTEQLMDSLENAAATLQEHFGRLDVPWSQVNRLLRGDVDLGLGGGPDLLHAIYSDRQEDGRLAGNAGDSYVLLVRWDPARQVESYSIHQFGSATLDETSPHYADQAPLFAQRQLKPIWLDEAEIRANLEREYRPGE